MAKRFSDAHTFVLVLIVVGTLAFGGDDLPWLFEEHVPPGGEQG